MVTIHPSPKRWESSRIVSCTDRLDKVEKYIDKVNNEEIKRCAEANKKYREYEAYANSYEGRKGWSDYVDSCFQRDAEIRREEEKLERLF